MGSPETSDTDQVTGTWVTVQPGLPETFTTVIETIQSLLEALLAILNIALAVLQIIKAVLIGLLDPLTAIINAIINEIEALLQDIRQIGVYMAGDLVFEPPQFGALLGGFTAYERRMVGRLVNRSDPTRPAFTSRTQVIAVFLYGSVDTAGISDLVKIVQRVMAFFGRTIPVRSYTTPVSLEAAYGIDGATLATFGPMSKALRQGDVPNQVNLSWQMAPPAGGGQVRWPSLAPKGFLIEVSTVPGGLLLAYDTYVANATVGPDANIRQQGLIRDPQTGTTFRLYGGTNMIDVEDLADIPYDSTGDGSDRKTRLYGYRDSSDNVPIPLDTLIDSSGTEPKFLLQRTYFVKAGFIDSIGPGQGFAVTLAGEDMPYEATFEVNDGVVETEAEDDPATTVYVRISAVTEEIADVVVTEGGTGENGWLTSPLDFWFINARLIAQAAQADGNVSLYVFDFSNGDKTEPSTPLTVTFPAADTQEYLDTVTAAIAVLALSRSDLPQIEDGLTFQTGKTGTLTGLEEIGKFLVERVVGRNKRYFERRGVPPYNFRQDFLRRCRALANDLYTMTGPLGDIEGLVVERGADLLSFKWSEANSAYPDLTILESLGADSSLEPNTYEGVGLNPHSMSLNEQATVMLFFDPVSALNISRTPGFLLSPRARSEFFDTGGGSADMSPVIYQTGKTRGVSGAASNTADFCRNALTDEVYDAAALVLNIAASALTLPAVPGAGSWTAVRLFPQGLPAVEAVLDQIIGWVNAIKIGVQGIVDLIVSYIEFLQARILEMQALIVRINGLLASLTGFNLPLMSGLVVTSNGTDGVLSDLITADNKPSDGVDAYGAGLVLLAGGLPSILIELIQAFFPEAE